MSPRIRIYKVPVLDTGIGREAGFESDKELIAAAQAERDALPPEVRQLADAVDEEIDRAFLFGDSPP